MDEHLEKQFQDSENEWAEIERLTAIRTKKDKRIISQYCAQNNEADIIHTLELLEKYSGMPSHDKEILDQFKENYPKALTVKLIYSFEDMRDIYQDYLEFGEEH